MILPKNLGELTQTALDLIEACNITRGERAAAYRQYMMWVESGQTRQSSSTGGSNYLALANMLYSHVDRLAAHLYSPTDLRFAVDFKNHYPKVFLDRAAVAARILSREWELNDLDTDFGMAVKEALIYGSVFLKCNPKVVGHDISLESEVVMPWNFGVYNETKNGLDKQEAVCETLWIDRHEVWRHVRHRPDANRLFRRIIEHSRPESKNRLPASFMHQVLSTAVLDVEGRNATRPGGIVNFANAPTYGALGPSVGVELYPLYELYVRDDEREDDYTTIQLIEPDILISPTETYRTNLFCKGYQPYTLVQANTTKGYLYGRSEVVDLMRLQDWLTEHLNDVRRLMELQIEKFIGFEGLDAITDEIYGQMRRPGFISVPQGGKINDLTPPFPAEMIPMVQLILQLMDRVSGFPPIMSGEGQPGVRADSHANTLMRTGSPRLRDRSLLVERQCATFAQTTLAVLREKDGRSYWVNPDDDKDSFLLEDLPDDIRVSVDSHSGSPIYHDDHANLISWGMRVGALGPEDAIEDLPFSHKDTKLQRLKERAQQRQQFIEQHPEVLEQHGGRRQPLRAA